ncbi:DUF1878 family protein [Bacillus spongiae]|uniref:DUF1878 family protein n=1 Tax=Bacillus spongiae TaxID=2683610 RepID=A0ABU8HBA6_9BACI
MDEIVKRIEMLEFHQQLMISMLNTNGREFDYLIIKKRLSKQEVDDFFMLCEEMNKKRETQKADQFVFYTPLFNEFKEKIHSNLPVEETINACLKQNIYSELMMLLKKNL